MKIQNWELNEVEEKKKVKENKLMIKLNKLFLFAPSSNCTYLTC